MARRTYKVANKCSIMSGGKTNIVLNAGTVITPEVAAQYGLTDKMLDEHLRSGYLIDYNVVIDPYEARFATPPGVTTEDAVRIKPDQAIQTAGRAEDVVSMAGPKDTTPRISPQETQPVVGPGQIEQTVQTVPASRTPGMPQVSIWTMDPAVLVGKSLAELNVMISERNPQIDPMQSINDAVHLLSMDYIPATADPVVGTPVAAAPVAAAPVASSQVAT